MQHLRKGFLIAFFARHKVAGNLLMFLILIAGTFALLKLNTQFFPTFHLELITINVPWPSASAEDVERSIINPLELELRNVDHLKKMSSKATVGDADITLEFKQGTDMSLALEQVKERVAQVRNLPEDSEEPQITRVENFERIAKLLITGPNLKELRPRIHQMERELLDRGIAKVTVTGLPEEEIAIQIPSARLAELNRSLTNIADKVAALSKDLPAGTVGRGQFATQLRSLDQRRSIKEFEKLPIITGQDGRVLRLGDIAIIERQPRENEVKVFVNSHPAVEMTLYRSETTNALHSAKVLQQWLKVTRPTLPKSVNIQVYYKVWQHIQERINLLLKNGLTGLILIIIILFLFLNSRVAFWACVGIAIAFFGAFGVLYAFGGSINMISLFAFIMGFGIVVDDNIVVSEQTITKYQSGDAADDAAIFGATKMLKPVLASSLTTISAFIPLALITTYIGKLLGDIPLVVISLIIASLIECFLILPSHLSHSLARLQHHRENRFREWFDSKFNHFNYQYFRPAVKLAAQHYMTTISLALAILLFAIGLIVSGHINFTFFINPEGRLIQTNIKFLAGTPQKEIRNFLDELYTTLMATEAQLRKKEGKDIIAATVTYYNLIPSSSSNDPGLKSRGEEYASMNVELLSPDQRRTRNKDFIETWRKKITLPPGIERFTIVQRRAGIPGKDLDIRLSGSNAAVLKQAANSLKNTLKNYQGISDIEDNLPYGQKQLIFKLTHEGEALGLTINEVGQQLRAAYSGKLAQVYHLANDEIEVRVMLPRAERDSLNSLQQLPIITSQGQTVPLGTVVQLQSQAGFDILRHTDNQLSVNVSAEVDTRITNANKVINSLKQQTIPELERKYGIKTDFEGKNEEQELTLIDMEIGAAIALFLIYIILAWTFSSYAIPFIVMLAIPLGVTGAILGHVIMQLNLNILSLFGVLGLTGIIVNDSIILVLRYVDLKHKHDGEVLQTICEAACQRMRPVILTSITTIAGLSPLLFERSLQAQFLIPMATSIAFGLAYGTFLILLVIPASINVYEKLTTRH